MDLAQHTGVYLRIKRQVAEDAPERVAELDRILKAYDGDARLLGIFLDKFGSDNPFIAAQRAKLEQVIFRTPEEMKSEGEIAVSESGHRLMREMYVLRDPRNPTAVWQSGSQAIIKIMQSFGTAEQQALYTRKEGDPEKIGRERARELDDVVRTLEEVLENPSRVWKVQSITDRRKVEKILGLEKALWERLRRLDRWEYGATAFVEQKELTYLVAADEGGNFLGWFKRQQNELKPEIRDIYTTLVNPHMELSEAERRALLACLLAYAASHRYLRTEAAIGGYKQDLDLLLKLPEEHVLIQKYGRPDLTRVRNILEKPEISLLEATTIFDLYPVDQVRAEANQAYYQRFRPEADAVLARLKPLFIQDGRWREDALGTSIPLERIKKSIYFATLPREDFVPVRDVLRVKTLVTAEPRFYQALSMSDFRQKVDGIVVAARKVRLLDDVLHIEQVVIENPEEAEELVRQFKPIMPREEGLDLAENFEEEYGFSLEEFSRRIDFVQKKESLTGWKERKQRMEEYARYALYSPQEVEKLKAIKLNVIKLPAMEVSTGHSFFDAVRELIPYPALKEKVELAVAVLEHPLVLPFEKWHMIPSETQEFVEPEKCQVVEDILAVEAEIKRREQDYTGIEALLEKRKKWKSALLYGGGISTSVSVRQQPYEEQEPFTEIQGVKILHPPDLERHLETLEKEYVPVQELPENWIQKARYLVSRQEDPSLKKFPLHEADQVSRENVQNFKRGDKYVHKTLVEELEKWYGQMEKYFSFVPELLANGEEVFRAAQLFDKFQVKVKGTTAAEGRENRFRTAFYGFKYTPREGWHSRETLYKGWIGRMTEKLQEYNEKYQARIRIEVVKNV